MPGGSRRAMPRDIKPENILLDRSGTVKIADFGLAKLLEPDRADGVSLTETGAVMGTPAYMAPEQIEQPLNVDHRADIYAVGVVFYEMLTGELPLGRFDPPSRRVEMDVRLDHVILRALEKEPIRRYQLASDVTHDLENLDNVEPTPESPTSVAPGTRTITIKRPPAVSWIMVYSFVMSVLYPASTGSALMWLLLGFRGTDSSHGILNSTWSGSLAVGAAVIPAGAGLCLMFSVLHLIAGLGAVKLRNWSRYCLIVLALAELPGILLALHSWIFILLLPITIVSAMILFYLFKAPVARIFELGPGPANLPVAEADEIERVVGR